MLQDFCQDLSKIALGWLGWSEWQTLHSDINAIQLAWLGHIEKFNASMGKKPTGGRGGPIPPSQTGATAAATRGGAKMFYGGGGKPLVLTPESFDAVFGNKAGRRRFTKPKR